MTTRVQVWSNRKMVTLQAAVVPVPEGDPVLLYGETDGRPGEVTVVTLDDGRQLLIAVRDLEVIP